MKARFPRVQVLGLLIASVWGAVPLACSGGGGGDNAGSGGDNAGGDSGGNAGNDQTGGTTGDGGNDETGGDPGGGGTGGTVADAGTGGATGDAAVSTDSLPTLRYFAYASASTVPFIRGWKYDIETGALTEPVSTAAGTGITAPTYLAFRPDGKNVYVSNETSTGVLGALSIVPVTGKLTAQSQKPSGGAASVHTSVHPSGKWAFVANYNAANVRVFAITASGDLGDEADTEVTGVNPHQVKLSPDGKYAFVPCRGPNHVMQFKFDDATGQLTANDPATIAADDPRHLTFHRGKDFAYLVNEKPANVVVYAYDKAGGKLSEIQKIDLDPLEAWGGHIEVTPDGKFVYVSGRDTAKMFIYEINPTDGKLTAKPSFDGTDLIDIPRDFTVDPLGNHLLVASRGIGKLAVLKINKETGALTLVGELVQAMLGVSAVIVVPVNGP